MIIEAVAVATGLWVLICDASQYWVKAILKHPFIFNLCAFIILLMIHGGSSGGAMIITMSCLLLHGAHKLARRYYGY